MLTSEITKGEVERHIKSDVGKVLEKLQVGYLYFLYHKKDVVNTAEFAEKMVFNPITASRALNDLYHANLITYVIRVRQGVETNIEGFQTQTIFKSDERI